MARGVLHVLGSAAPDGTGIARMVGSLASGLDREAYRLHVCFLGTPGPLTDELARRGLDARALDWQGGARDAAGARRFWQQLRSGCFSIIHQHAGGRSVRWVARAAGRAAIVVHLHGHVLEGTGAPAATPGLRDADAVIATSESVAKHAAFLRARVVYPGVPPFTRITALSPGVIGAAGRLVPLKGHADLIRAAALLGPVWPTLRVEIAGEGSERPALEALVRQLGLNGRVVFLGWQRNLDAALARWEIFVQPSLEEGFGLAALEAMAAGLPVVATRVGGLPELVVDGSTGFLVPPANSSSLAATLARLLADRELGCAMGAAGRRRARAHFSVTRMARATSEVYEALAVRTPAA